jgi:predicted ATPase
MITRFRVQNFKALRDVTLDLTPIHVLIGPNDTGKTSILEALYVLSKSTQGGELGNAFKGPWEGRTLVWNQLESAVSLKVTVKDAQGEFEYRLECTFAPGMRCSWVKSEDFSAPGVHVRFGSENSQKTRVALVAGHSNVDEDERVAAIRVVEALRGVQYHQWDPRLLALPAALDASRRFQLDPSGFGLVLCLDDIAGDNPRRFIEMQERFKELFPQIHAIKLPQEKAFLAQQDISVSVPRLIQTVDGKGIRFLMSNGTELPAGQVSDGIVFVLAYLTLLHLPQPPRVILVEEPENGVHPARLGEIIGFLRELIGEQNQTQVILTTHSPYLLDSFKPEEVTLCRRQPDGSISVHRLSESKAVREQLDVFTLGEIWTAEGDDALAEPIEKGSGSEE